MSIDHFCSELMTMLKTIAASTVSALCLIGASATSAHEGQGDYAFQSVRYYSRYEAAEARCHRLRYERERERCLHEVWEHRRAERYGWR